MIHPSSNTIPCDVKDAFWDELMNWIESGCHHLQTQDIYMLCERFTRTQYTGVMHVAVDQIHADMRFSRTLSKRFSSSEQHGSLVELLKVGNTYFVLHGHPEFSVSRENNQLYLEACVIEALAD